MRVTHISVDLTEANRYIVHAKIELPVQPGTIARFTTPVWLTESHERNGPVWALAGLHFFCHQKELTTELKWSRDPQAGHEYLLHVPRDVDTIHGEFDAIITKNVTRRIILFQWVHVLLYPICNSESRGSSRFNIHKIPIQATVTVPKGWGIATALENLGDPIVVADETKETYTYATTTVQGLADSPILAGLFFKTHRIEGSSNEQTREVLCIAADQEQYVAITPPSLDNLSKIISQVQLLFGAEPEKRTRYFFLVALSSHLDNWGGVEHLYSTAIVARLMAFSYSTQTKETLQLLAHEYIHSWNGKRLIPKGHNPNDFNTPLDGRLLWVYEGLTTYYETVIAARAGVLSKEEWVSQLASHVAERMGETATQWRSLEDLGTGNDVDHMGARVDSWRSWRGDRDGFYNGGALVWLGVDVLLRRLTAKSKTGAKSLDDFMELFFGESVPELQHRRRGATLIEYTLDDIARELNKICEYDWKGHFQATVVDVLPEVDMSGIANAGYTFRWDADAWTMKLPHKDRHSAEEHKHVADERKIDDDDMQDAIWNSIGILVSWNGEVIDVRRWGPGDAAGLAPRQRIAEVYDPCFGGLSLLVKAIRKSADTKEPIKLLMTHQRDNWTAEIQYLDGIRYPVIERDEDGGLSDLFEDILRPLAPSYQLVHR
ncbi:peptidase m61 domain protein [Rhypophila decipiens]|uniref:Peptidase m61 domain protein n=1 Tax=Rhypophila decipiens TaxID=261697 RepID=A0AAN6XWL6_9PEZI|nr:peptidase m61 domain protein [Rhypophila decipiens]